ncbi:3-phosphoserine/phosphohydroxythreonine transaminase [Thermodesulforhabdus norvegica]|uniref:Phosphoserine aminotransferase n=1 Tax=Thermodesulforhabdus norvegica TaxID=39841 RepID=A0A1I4U6W9_9BACT|nr:3-phosphoserine/phosphohydroxythreonine transaminase [Thermodesulforhabdus norvegica]SFM84718.1 phosphoserine aminotransferase apoenzyme [Thermodesulforhabdus norvegica]
MTTRVYNFNPGPAALPLPVLERVRDELLDYKGTGMSVMEMSHRSQEFSRILEEAIARIKRLLKLDDRFQVLFLQGGASLQFCMVPMNLALTGKPIDYIDTGTWSSKAIQEAKILGKDVRVIASSEDKEYSYIPGNFSVDEDASYLHITSNNTIRGTQWKSFPNTGGIPLVADMSSDIFSRVFDPSPFGLIYAGAQKNAGPAGVTIVIIRKDMLERVPPELPTMLKYTTYAEKNSLYNTPPCFAIYVVGLVMEWLEEEIGGLEKMEAINRSKAEMLYSCIDEIEMYRGTAHPDSRSMMNVTFRLPTPELEKKFVEEAAQRGLVGLKGHRSVGGCRASLYNAVPVEAVEKLVEFMREFARNN